LMRVKPCFLKTGKTLVFRKKQKPGKRRLARSTQFSRNRIPGPTRGRRRSPGVHAQKTPPEGGSFSIAKILALRQRLSASRGRGSRTKRFRKNRKPLRGREI